MSKIGNDFPTDCVVKTQGFLSSDGPTLQEGPSNGSIENTTFDGCAVDGPPVCSPIMEDLDNGIVDVQLPALQDDEDQKWLENVLDSLGSTSGEIPVSGRSRHCWFLTPSVRNCCDAHNILDTDTMANMAFADLRRQMCNPVGPCPGLCMECNPLSLQAGEEEIEDESVDEQLSQRVVDHVRARVHALCRVGQRASGYIGGKINDALGSMTRGIISQFFQTISTMFREKAEAAMSWVIPLSLVTICISMLINYKDEAFAMIDTLISFASHFLSVMGTSIAPHMANVWSILRGLFKPVRKLFPSTGEEGSNDDIVLQSGSNPFSVLTAFAVLLMSTKEISAKSVTEAMGCAARTVPVISSLGAVAVWATKYLPKTLAEYAVVVCGFITPADFSKEARIELARANDLRARFDQEGHEAYKDPAFCGAVMRTHTKLAKMMSVELMSYSATSHKRIYYKEALASLAGLVKVAKERSTHEYSRLEPVGVWIIGTPGIGKTAIIKSLVAAVHDTRYEYDLLYNKNISEKFWSGYKGQKAVLVDDFGAQDSDVAKAFNGNCLTYMSSAAGATLDMAFDKGAMFTSESMWLTGNKPFGQPVPGISEHGAFLRRFSVRVVMKLKREFIKGGQLNLDRYMAMTRDEVKKQSHCFFERHSGGYRNPKIERIDYNELVLLIRAELRGKQLMHNVIQSRRMQSASENVAPIANLSLDTTLQGGDPTSDYLELQDRSDLRETWARNVVRCPVPTVKHKLRAYVKVFLYKHAMGKAPIQFDLPMVMDYLTGDVCICYEEGEEDCPVCYDEEVKHFRGTDDWLNAPIDMDDVREHADELVAVEEMPEVVSVKDSLARWRRGLALWFMDREVAGVKIMTLVRSCFAVGAVVAVASIFAKPKSLVDGSNDEVTDALAPDAITVLFGDDCEFSDLQARYEGSKQRIANFRKARAVRQQPVTVVQHAVLDAGKAVPEHRVNEAEVVKRNMGRLVIGEVCVHVLFVSGTVALTVNHVFFENGDSGISLRKEGTPMCLKFGGSSYDIAFKAARMIRLSVSDNGLFNEICSYDFGGVVPSCRDISKMFITEEQVQYRRAIQLHLLRMQPGGAHFTTRAGNATACSDRLSIPSVSGRADSRRKATTEVLHRWDYDVSTMPGDCGSVGMSSESTTNAIVCLHFAYNRSARRGMGSTVTQDFVARHLAAHTENITLDAGSCDYFNNVVYRGKVPQRLHPNVDPIGFIDDPMLPGSNSKSKLVESVFREHLGDFKDAYVPAALGPTESRPLDTVDTLVARDMSRVLAPEERIPDALLRMALSDVIGEISDHGVHGPLDVLSQEEVINGRGNYPHMKGIVMSTSAGYDARIVADHVGTKKSAYFDQREDGTYEFKTKAAQRVYDDDVAALDEGRLPVYVWSMSLKDELRPKAKAEAGFTRNINCSPLMMTCMTRRYFGSFINSFMSLDPVRSFSAVGLNVYSPEYNDFIQEKLRVSSHGFDGDLTKFESTFTTHVLETIGIVIESKFYGPNAPGCLGRRAIFRDLIHTMFRVGSKVHQKHGWNPSGTVLTTVINTIWTATLLRIAWVNIMRKMKPRIAGLSFFHRLVADASFGDDNRCNVAFEVSDCFNRKNVSEALRPYGIIMTSASKEDKSDGESLSFHTELEFLKGTTAVDVLAIPGVKYSFDTLEPSLMKSLLYVSGKQDFAGANVVNASNMLRRAFTKGRLYFAEKRNFVLGVLKKELNFRDHLITYDECERLFLSGMLEDEDDFAASIEEDFAFKFDYGRGLELQSGRAMGVTFTDPATIDTNYTRPNLDAESKIDSTIVERQVDMKDLVSRPQFVSSIDWTTSQSQGEIISRFELPADILTSRIMADPFTRFKYWRGSVCLSVRLQCTAFHAGMIRVFFQPLEAEFTPTRTSASVCQGFNMVAGSSQRGELRIPFVHPQAYMETKNPVVPLGTVFVMVFNTLRVGEVGAQSHQCTLSTYACIEDAEFKVIDPITDNVADDIILQGGLMSKVTNNNITLAAGATFTSTGDRDAFEGKTSNKVSGLDKPNIGIEAPPIRRRFAPDLANAANVGYKPVLGLYADEVDMLDPADAGTKLDEMGFDYLFQKESLTDTITMSRVTAPGTILAQYQITPCRKVQNLGSDPVEADLLEMTVLPFEQWRGDIIMVVELLGSSVNTARVAVCTHFGEVEAPDSLQAAMGQYAHVFDTTAETNRFEVVLPYTSRFEWMRVLHGTVPADRSIAEYSTGLVTLRAISRLTYTPAVTDEIDINIYFKAGPNFEVKWLGSGLSDFSLDGFMSMELQAGDLVGSPGNDQSDEVDSMAVAAPVGTAIAVVEANKEHYSSVNDLLQRSTKSVLNPAALVDFSVKDMLMENPYFFWFSHFFKIWKGGVCATVATRGDAAFTFLPEATIPGVDLSPSVGTNIINARNAQRGVPLTNCAGRNISLFTFAANYISPMKFMMFGSTASESFVNFGRIFGLITAPDSTASCGLYVAASDAMRMSYLYRVPTLSIADVGTLYYPHNVVAPFVVPSTVDFAPSFTSSGIELKQEDINTFVRGGFSAVDNNEFSVNTDTWSREMFEDYLGIVIPADQPFVRLGGSNATFHIQGNVLGVTSTIDVSQGPVGTITTYNLISKAVGPETRYVDKRGVEGVGSTAFVVEFKENLGNAADYAVLANMVPDTTTAVIWPINGTTSVVANTGPAILFGGQNFFEWDFKNSKAFV